MGTTMLMRCVVGGGGGPSRALGCTSRKVPGLGPGMKALGLRSGFFCKKTGTFLVPSVPVLGTKTTGVVGVLSLGGTGTCTWAQQGYKPCPGAEQGTRSSAGSANWPPPLQRLAALPNAAPEAWV